MQSTQDLIKQYFIYFNSQNTPAFLDLLAEDVIHDINQGDSEIGKEAFANFITRMRCYSETANDLIIMTNADGSRAAAEFKIDGRYMETDPGQPEAKGQRYHLDCGAFFHIRGGKIQRVTVYYNIQDWLKQVTK